MTLDEIIEDSRLNRLFFAIGEKCAIQLWVLQIVRDEVTTSKIVYGRVLPYSFANDRWGAPSEDRFRKFEGYSAQVICISLYCGAEKVPDLLRGLCSGEELRQVSLTHGFKSDSKFDVRFGGVRLDEKLLYRATSYLPMRSDLGERGLKSPHGDAGVFSAAIVQNGKMDVFHVGGVLDKNLLCYVVERLNSDTGLGFSREDSERLGDLELLVFPTLNEKEQSLLGVEWAKKGEVIKVLIYPNPFVTYTRYFIRARFENNAQIMHSTILYAPCAKGDVLPVEISLPSHLCKIIDRCHIEIHGEGESKEVELYAQWGCHYVREISLGVSIGSYLRQVKLDWLTKVTRLPADSDRLRNAQTISRGGREGVSLIGGRESDPWVSVNRRARLLLGKFVPSQSQGRFFERHSEGSGLGRLEFVEWWKEILQQYSDKQVVIFDPYFEDVGISLLMPNASSKGSYVVFTSAPRRDSDVEKGGWIARLLSSLKGAFCGNRKPDKGGGRINNLLAACERFLPIISNVKLKVFALPNEPLHDRYILAIDSDGEPVAGFHMSNSIQKATENYPLLITPMPDDVLLKVTEYSEALLKRFLGGKVDQVSGQDVSSVMIFDSEKMDALGRAKIRYEPLGFLDGADAGTVLAIWTHRSEFAGLYGEKLRHKLVELSLMQNESLRGAAFSGAQGLIRLASEVAWEDFYKYWEVAGDILANTPSGDALFVASEIQSTDLPSLLLRYLIERSRHNDPSAVDTPDAVAISAYFDSTLDELLHSPIRVDQFFKSTKFKQLTWGEYFAIKILIEIRDEEFLELLVEPRFLGSEFCSNREESKFAVVRAQAMGEIALHLGLGDGGLFFPLVRSKSAFFRWLAYSEFESSSSMVCAENSMMEQVIQDNDEIVRVLGWLINRSSRGRDFPPVIGALSRKLISKLPPTLDEKAVRLLVHSCTGHMKSLGHCMPWLGNQILLPLVLDNRISIDHLVDIFLDEIEGKFDKFISGSNALFVASVEGNVTRFSAFFIANANPEKMIESFERLDRYLRKIERDIRMPLASTTNWRRWDASLKVAFWIYGVVKWVHDFMPLPNRGEPELFRVFRRAELQSHIRTVSDWAEATHAGGEFAVFLSSREELERN